MKLIRALSIAFAIFIPTAAIASPTGAVATLMSCCGMCPHC
jgi:hypothetical protein